MYGPTPTAIKEIQIPSTHQISNDEFRCDGNAHKFATLGLINAIHLLFHLILRISNGKPETQIQLSALMHTMRTQRCSAVALLGTSIA